MKTAFKTDRGKIREHNEDSGGLFFNKTDQLLAIVADGMGGHRAGDVASTLTLDYIKENWEKTERLDSEASIKKWLEDVISEINSVILSYAEEHPECLGMGTTVVIAICTEEFTIVAHIGDSRCYLLKKGKLNQVTSDHSLVNELVRQGEISEEEAVSHPQKHVLLKALGVEPLIKSEVKKAEWHPGDIVLLCSDGLTNSVNDQQLETVLLSEKKLQVKVDILIELANEAGGDDNITLALVQLAGQESSPINDGEPGVATDAESTKGRMEE